MLTEMGIYVFYICLCKIRVVSVLIKMKAQLSL